VHGISGGGPFALALAAVAPERVDRVVVSAGPGSHAELGGLSPTASAAMESARSGDRDAAWRMLHAEAAHVYGDAAAMSCAEFQTHLFSSGPPPQSYFDGRAELFRVFVADMHRAVQHLDGYVRDSLSWCGAWDIDIATVRAPVLLAYGRDDQMTLPAHGEWLDARLPNSQLRICPGGHGDIAFGLAADAYAYLVNERT
jgi:pimeloyl-ACP methyl ester carboxylesterase